MESLGVSNVWNRKKGLDTFVELSEKLKEEYKVVLVGVTEKQKKNLSHKIIGITRTQDITELSEIYAAASIFVNPTLEDTFPTVNLEALACGTPIITYDTGGSKECIDTTCGRSVEKEDVLKLINEIEQFTIDESIKEFSRNRAKLYEKNLKYLEYIDLYGKLMEERNESFIFN